MNMKNGWGLNPITTPYQLCDHMTLGKFDLGSRHVALESLPSQGGCECQQRSDSRDASSTNPGSGPPLRPSPAPDQSLFLPHRHWLSSAYTQFAVPYFIYDIYAMFLCHWHKHQVKGHGGDEGGARAPGGTWAVARGYLQKEFLMVLHHAAMVLVCFPLSVVSRAAASQRPLSCSCQHGGDRGAPGPGPSSRAGSGWTSPAEGSLSTGPAQAARGRWVSLAWQGHPQRRRFGAAVACL